MSENHAYQQERERLKAECKQSDVIQWECPHCDKVVSAKSEAVQEMLQDSGLCLFACPCGASSELSHVEPEGVSND